jgi:glycosyltransferase involved in cell wall biosynthesis
MSLSVLSIAYPLAPVGPDAAGGSEQILSLLDRTLVRHGHRSVVIACEGSSVAGKLLAAPLPRGELNGSVHAAAQDYYRSLIQRALNRWSFDLIHMHSLDFHAYLPPPGPPVLVTLHLPPDWYPESIFRLARPNTKLLCVSQAQEKSCPASDILLGHIANGVPVERFPPAVRKGGFALTLGRICPEKGFHLALDAAREARIPAVIAGEVFRYRAHQDYFTNEILARLEVAHSSNNGVRPSRFIGPVGFARKRRLLATARCLLAPSLVPETSSLVSMEAMACGTPVIAFPSGALPEIVEHGRTGFIVNDAHEMADAIRQVDEIDPEECRATARKRFSARRMINEYLSWYKRLASACPSFAEIPAKETGRFVY